MQSLANFGFNIFFGYFGLLAIIVIGFFILVFLAWLITQVSNIDDKQKAELKKAALFIGALLLISWIVDIFQ